MPCAFAASTMMVAADLPPSVYLASAERVPHGVLSRNFWTSATVSVSASRIDLSSRTALQSNGRSVTLEVVPRAGSSAAGAEHATVERSPEEEGSARESEESKRVAAVHGLPECHMCANVEMWKIQWLAERTAPRPPETGEPLIHGGRVVPRGPGWSTAGSRSLASLRTGQSSGQPFALRVSRGPLLGLRKARRSSLDVAQSAPSRSPGKLAARLEARTESRPWRMLNSRQRCRPVITKEPIRVH